jgi:hypothetical protein
MSALSLLGVMCLGSPRIVVSRATAAIFAAIVIVLSVGAVTVSPLIALLRLKGGIENEALYTRPLAHEIDRALDQEQQSPPRFLVGNYSLANSVAFYMRERPFPVSIDVPTRARWSASTGPDESVTICVASDDACRKNPRIHPRARWQAITVEPIYFGMRGTPETFVLRIKPRDNAPAPGNEVADEFSATRRVGASPIP